MFHHVCIAVIMISTLLEWGAVLLFGKTGTDFVAVDLVTPLHPVILVLMVQILNRSYCCRILLIPMFIELLESAAFRRLWRQLQVMFP